MTLNTRILLGAIAGIALGSAFLLAGDASAFTQQGLYFCNLVSTVFVDMLKMVLMPLMFTSIVVGVANLRAHEQIHKVWAVMLTYSLTTLSISIFIGLMAANIFRPGSELRIEAFAEAMNNFDAASMSMSEFFTKFLHSLFMNPFAAMANNSVLAIVVFALIAGIAIVTGGERYKNLLNVLEEGFDLTMRVVQWIMYIAPFGIAALLAKLVATESVALLGSLAKFIAVVMGTTLLHGLVVLPLILVVLTRMHPLRFFRGARPALVTAFATSSSAATMPVTLDCLEQDLKVTPDVARFVVPVGSHLNMDGTALYEAAAALFVANLSGIDLSVGQQLIVCFTTMLASVGAPGIPSAGMVTMIMVLQSVGLPAEAVAILLPIDRLLDTVRTMVNVEGDMIASLVVDKLTKSSPAAPG